MGEIGKTYALFLTLIIAMSCLTSLMAKSANAQVPTPPDVPILGPVIICSAGDPANFVIVTSPVNQTVYANPVQLTFATQQMLMYGDSYNVGYSLDNSEVSSVSMNFSYNSNDNDTVGYPVTGGGALILPVLSEGPHIITVYAGWQYLGVNKRFEVYAYSTVNFTVGNPDNIATTNPQDSFSPTLTPTSTPKPATLTPTPTPTATPTATPTPTVPEFSWLAIIPLLVYVLFVAVMLRHRKNQDK